MDREEPQSPPFSSPQARKVLAVLGAAGLAVGLEKVKREFDKNEISIPYPQTDVHLHRE